MASGFGYTGGRSRCFPFWQEFSKCYASASEPQECIAPKEDYMECLHGNKEVARALTIKSHYLAQAKKEHENKQQETEQTVTSGIMSLGLDVGGHAAPAGQAKADA